jgi:hypothetical protein
MELSLKEKQKLTAVTAKNYRAAKKKEKGKILDAFTGQTGYGRKYAIHILLISLYKESVRTAL